MTTIPSNSKIINNEYYSYSNGSYEQRQATFLEENATVAKTINYSRSIHGPIPRDELRKLVEHIDLGSPTWEEEMKKVLADQQFVVNSINANSEHEQNQMGMTTKSYLETYFNWKAVGLTATAMATFFAPAIIKDYFPGISEALRLPSKEENQNAVSYSGMAWRDGIKYASAQLTQLKDAVPSYITTPALSYFGYKGLEEFVTRTIQYPATDYRTWAALNLQKYLEHVYPKLIPEQYQNDPILSKIVSPDGRPIRSPFFIDRPEEINRLYEEHVLKNILNNQKKLTSKLTCPIDGKTEIQPSDIKRDELLSDRIELRLLLLDAHRLKEQASEEDDAFSDEGFSTMFETKDLYERVSKDDGIDSAPLFL